MPKTRRRTRRTDSNGALKEAYKELWDRVQLDNARLAGIPSKMLDPSGSDDWRATGDTLGLWSELVYTLSDCLRGEDALGNPRRDNIGIVEEVFGWMYKLAQGLGIDPETPGLIPWEVWTIRRELSPSAALEDRSGGEAQAAQDAEASQSEVVEAVMDEWECPSDPAHDSHGHGLSNGSWKCFPEEDS
jgi:hypothetical protein